MTITLDLAPEDAARLNGIAAKKGRDADAVAYSLLATALAQESHRDERTIEVLSRPLTVWTEEFRAKYEIPADVQPFVEEDMTLTPEEEIEAIRLGLEDSSAGRVTPLAEWSAKVRARHNFPEDTPVMTHEEAMLLP